MNEKSTTVVALNGLFALDDNVTLSRVIGVSSNGDWKFESATLKQEKED